MTKFYRSHGRQRSSRKLYIILSLVLLLLVGSGIGYAIWQKRYSDGKKNAASVDVPKYFSLSGNYLFSIPAKYTVDETAIPGLTLVYPESLAAANLKGKSLEDLYKAGAVAVQPIADLKDNNPKAFKEYVNNKLAEGLRKSLRSNVDVRESKHGTVLALKIFTLAPDGKRLNAMYAINQTRPVLMVAKEESNTLKIVGSSMEDLQAVKSKPDLDKVVEATKVVVEMMQKQDVSGIKGKGNTEFNKNASKEKLTAELKTSAAYLARSITITGGSYNGKDFVAQLIFEPKTQDETHARGTVSMQKQGNSWLVQALELPTQ